MTDNEQHPLFDSVDALLAAVESGEVLPAPSERLRLRLAAGLSEAAVAAALKVRVPSITAWEAGRSEPTGQKREAYKRLLDGLAAKFPTAPAPVPAPVPVPVAAPAEPVREEAPPARVPVPEPEPVPAGVPVPERRAGTVVVPAAGRQFAHGPLLVLDGDGQAYGVGGLVLECPAKTLPALVEWTLTQAQIGTPRLHASGKEGDPLVVLTASAVERFKLPSTLEDRVGLRLEDKHPVHKQLAKGNWKLTRRGFGPWARIYRPAQGGRRYCVQLALLPWGALDPRTWGRNASSLPAAEVAKLLGDFAVRVITPTGGGAVTGQALMTALRPSTHAVKELRRDGDTGEVVEAWVSGPMAGSLVVARDPAPPEAPAAHPLVADLYRGAVKPTPDQMINEESYEWRRDPELLTDAECALPVCVGIDVNMAFAAASNRLVLGLGEAVHLPRPRFFDKKLPGSWLYDLTVIPLDPRLPSPFTPTGETPTGPAWYTTPTVAYAHELIAALGLDLALEPLEAWVRPNPQQLAQLGVPVPPAPWESGDGAQLERLGLNDLSPERLAFLARVQRFDNGAYLDPWYVRLRDAYLATMAEAGVGTELDPVAFLKAMEPVHAKLIDPGQLAVLAAIKAAAKGAIGKLKENPQGAAYVPGQPWPALMRPLWDPLMRATVIAACRANMHRKLTAYALKADLWPMAILSDCVVYASRGASPLDFMPYREGKPLPGGFRLGVNPGMVKFEGAQDFLWAAQLLDQGLNPARHIKGGDAVLDDGE